MMAFLMHHRTMMKRTRMIKTENAGRRSSRVVVVELERWRPAYIIYATGQNIPLGAEQKSNKDFNGNGSEMVHG